MSPPFSPWDERTFLLLFISKCPPAHSVRNLRIVRILRWDRRKGQYELLSSFAFCSPLTSMIPIVRFSAHSVLKLVISTNCVITNWRARVLLPTSDLRNCCHLAHPIIRKSWLIYSSLQDVFQSHSLETVKWFPPQFNSEAHQVLHQFNRTNDLPYEFHY